MFGGGLAAWMFEGLGGIRKCAAGYARTTFRPGIESGLNHARVSINALVGTLSSDWKIEDDDLIWNIEVPANTTATVIIPMPAAQRITESSKDIFMRSVDGITYVGQGTQGEYIYAVGSGRYSFMVSKRIFV
jgi:alpha-L-rhamnosidase